MAQPSSSNPTAMSYASPSLPPSRISTRIAEDRSEEQAASLLIDSSLLPGAPSKEVIHGLKAPNLYTLNVSNRKHRINHLPQIFAAFAQSSVATGFWFIVNAPELPDVPDPVNASPPTSSPHKPAWFDLQRPWAGFHPTFGFNEGETLNSVSIPNAQISTFIHMSGGLYSLEKKIVDEWERLEEGFNGVYHMLVADDVLKHLPPFSRPKPPSSYGYRMQHSSREAAINSVRLARNAFVRAASLTTFLLAFWRIPQLLDPLEHLTNRCLSISPQAAYWMEAFVSRSSIGRFHSGLRTGFFLDLFESNNPWLQYLHIFAEAGVPLFIYAGQEPKQRLSALQEQNPSLYNSAAPWVPTTLRLEAAAGKFLSGMLHTVAPPFEFWKSQGFEHGHLPQPPAPAMEEDYSPGMEPQAYFAILEDKVKTWKNNAWFTQEAITYREEAAHLTSWNSHYHETMAMRLWEEEAGRWSRRTLSQTSKRAHFDSHAPSQRFYYPPSNRMELCWLLDTAAGRPHTSITGEEMQEENDEHTFGGSFPDYDMDPVIPDLPSMHVDDDTEMGSIEDPSTTLRTTNLPSSTSPPVQHNPCELDSESDYGDDSDDSAPISPRRKHLKPKSQPQRPPQSSSLHVRIPPAIPSTLHTSVSIPYVDQNLVNSLFQRLADRLGYNPEKPLPASHPSWLARLASLGTYGDLDSITRHNFDAETRAMWVPINRPVEDVVVQFLGYRSRLGQFLSLNQLDALKDVVVTLQNVTYGDARDSFPSRWDITRPWKLDNPDLRFDRLFYLDRATKELRTRALLATTAPYRNQMFILVASATNLLQAKRKIIDEGKGIMASARYFIDRGIAFYTAKVQTGVAPRPPGVLRRTLGSLLKGEPLSEERYMLYREDCQRMLASSRGPLALKAGGILWRLSYHIATPKAVDELLRRPLHRSISNENFLCGWDDRYYFYDEVLAPYEVDRLLGTYNCIEIEGDRVVKTNVSTLWPTPYAWTASGLNTGEWNDGAEAWFRDHLARLEQGLAEPKTSTAWKTELGKLRSSSILWKGYDKVAGDYLLQGSSRT